MAPSILVLMDSGMYANSPREQNLGFFSFLFLLPVKSKEAIMKNSTQSKCLDKVCSVCADT